ncbi:acetyl-CoA carboxyl transferase [Microbacterium sp. STN6]|uniref:acetyl-coenzyme A carboxylase carboxyl transferase subunits beta/alpha n=1 Tax=Microbacterium sp. STN6 TaxID=2995588 RepID=UPI002260C02B|nr:carboxyl transferase domain-containing protein [Microbacterium sp. STN6]MCX7520773.1 acetyl-CoA carboxyl transferase [Microbacterium sp. STN6]
MPGARELIALLCDDGSFVSWDEEPLDTHPEEAYAAALQRARERSGVDESVLTGEGLVRGRRVALVASEFAFMAGSIGRAAAERLTLAIERATREGIPLLAGPASGGTRMQEGTAAFVAMVKISAAIGRHKSAGLPYLVYLRHPTTGGVMASWASQGHVTVAEPGALVGFLGPRVYEAIYGAPFPEGVQTSENLYRHGLIDGVLEPQQLPEIIDRALNVLLAPRTTSVASTVTADSPEPPTLPPGTGVAAWEAVERSRRPDRPGLRALLRHAASDVLPLNGTGQGENEPGLLLALARFGDAPCVVLGQDRQTQRSAGPLGPAALREARRGMRLSHELGLPLVTVIDTPGAALSQQAEEGGLAGEISRCLSDLVALAAPTVSLILGEGSGGGALALLPADRTLAAQHAWLSPLPPEGASAILFRDTTHAAELAEAQGIGASALLRAGIVDAIVPETPDAADEARAFCRRTGQALEHALHALGDMRSHERLAERHRRFRALGL